MSLLTYLDPNAIKDASIEGIKIKDNSISSSKIDETVASKSYVDAQVKTVDDKTVALEAKEITYSELKALRDAGKLIPGTQYRITDYQCTTTQENTQSAGHQFDIIVKADSENKLNEEANAIQHTEDDIDYFANSDLSAWKIWYCLDNDTTRFAWADATNGKGVIYRMIDEFNNDVPYDFKNIQFKRYAVTDVTNKRLTSDALDRLRHTFIYIENEQPIHFSFSSSNINNEGSSLAVDNNNYGWYYTFSTIKFGSSVIEDASVIGVNFFDNDEGGGGCFNNKIEAYRNFKASENDGLNGCCVLNNIVFNGRYNQNGIAFNAYSNHIKSQSYSNTFGGGCCSNTFGDGCYSNTFGNRIQENTFGNKCWFNTFGDGCYSNIFGNNFHYNTFGNYCAFNTVGNDCNHNTFGNECTHNTFGNNCHSNTFGNDCRYNTFGDGCYSNTFGNNCGSNTFGNVCDSNTFGNECHGNTFGNVCQYIEFASDISASTKYNYYHQNHFGDGCRRILFKGEETASDSQQVQNYNFAQGLQGTRNAYLTIDGVRNLAYETKVAKNSSGEVKTYCEADLIL